MAQFGLGSAVDNSPLPEGFGLINRRWSLNDKQGRKVEWFEISSLFRAPAEAGFSGRDRWGSDELLLFLIIGAEEFSKGLTWPVDGIGSAVPYRIVFDRR